MNRITSYNVCYTKLLRFQTAPEFQPDQSAVAKHRIAPVIPVGPGPKATIRGHSTSEELAETGRGIKPLRPLVNLLFYRPLCHSCKKDREQYDQETEHDEIGIGEPCVGRAHYRVQPAKRQTVGRPRHAEWLSYNFV